MDSSKLLPLLIFVGIVCICIGLYSVLRQPDIEPPSGPANSSGQTITVDARQVWTDTGIRLEQGDRFSLRAGGQVNIGSPGDAADRWVGPDGWGYIPQFNSPSGRPHRYVYGTNTSAGSLVGKIGGGKPFQIGRSYSAAAPASGTLYLGVNDVISDSAGRILDESSAASLMFSNNRGSFTATVNVGR